MPFKILVRLLHSIYMLASSNELNCLHSLSFQVVRSKINMIQIYNLHCHFHTSIRVMTNKHLCLQKQHISNAVVRVLVMGWSIIM